MVRKYMRHFSESNSEKNSIKQLCKGGAWTFINIQIWKYCACVARMCFNTSWTVSNKRKRFIHLPRESFFFDDPVTAWQIACDQERTQLIFRCYSKGVMFVPAVRSFTTETKEFNWLESVNCVINGRGENSVRLEVITEKEIHTHTHTQKCPKFRSWLEKKKRKKKRIELNRLHALSVVYVRALFTSSSS